MRLNVTQLNNQIKAVIENHFEIVEVEAEISQVTYHHTGHIYFSIKDENSMLNCAMWRSNVKNLKFKLSQGQKVIVYGVLSVYTPKGEYKLIATKITPSGVGDLQFAFEQLKKELFQKGYFNKNKPLPKFPKNVAIITANPSAALSDMLKIASKRWPLVKFYIYNTLVQGENAKYDIANSIQLADQNNHEVIILARGGGSLEDLWSFNTIEVANAIYQAKTPIISAIGHEVDVLISDYVADVRASTPSNAMEILLPDINEHFFMLDDLKNSFIYKISNFLQKKEQELKHLKNLYKQNSIPHQLQSKFDEIKYLRHQFYIRFENLIKQKEYQLPKIEEFNLKMSHFLHQKENQLNTIKKQFEFFNPQKRYKKGFVEITKDNQKVELKQLKENDIITISDIETKLNAKIIKG